MGYLETAKRFGQIKPAGNDLHSAMERSRESCPACLRADCRGCELEGAFLARRERAGELCQQAKNEWEGIRAQSLKEGLLEAVACEQATKEIRESRLFSEWRSI